MDINAIIATQNFDIALKLFTALCLGMSLGIERALAGKTAGMRTYGLVTMGSALFAILGVLASGGYGNPSAIGESTRFTASIISGIGFIGAGLIFFKDAKVSGVTTAAGIWVAAGTGIAIGYGFYVLAVVTTVLALLVFTTIWYIEHKLKAMIHFSEDEQDQ